MLWPFFSLAIVILITLYIVASHRKSSDGQGFAIAGLLLCGFFWGLFSLIVPMKEEQKLFKHGDFQYAQFNGVTTIVTNDGNSYSSDKAIFYITVPNPKSQFLVITKYSEWGISLDPQKELRIIIPSE